MTAAFLKATISLFVAIDALGTMPLFAAMTRDMPERERERMVYKAVAAALAVGLVFIFGGKAIFKFMGITENDFRVAGGIFLLAFALRDLLASPGHQGVPPTTTALGIVPIAIPLIMGPAALATLLLGAEEYGIGITIFGLVTNLAIVWLLFIRSNFFLKWMGTEVSEALAKIFSLLLAAIAVMLIRHGIKAMV